MDGDVMKKVVRVLSMLIAIISLMLLILGIILRQSGYVLNYEFCSGFRSYWIEFGLFELFSFILLMIKCKSKSIRVVLSVFALASCMIPGFLALMDTENLTTIEDENYTINISSYYFLRGGTDTVYQKHNVFISKYVDEFTTDEGNNVEYVINDNKLIVRTTWHNSRNIEVDEYWLD